MSLDTTTPRSRRAMLAGALGGLAGLVAGRLGRPEPAEAAAGSPLIIGSSSNNAGTANTQLLTNSNIVAFNLYQQGPGTALMGYTTPTSGATRGVYGRVDSPNGDGVQARNAGAAGTGAAIRAFGGNNIGVIGLAASGTTDDTHPSGIFYEAAGEFSGRNGIIGAATSDAFDGYGVIGTSPASSGHGVNGYATGNNAYGVYGYATGTTGTGTYGGAQTSNGVGVEGHNSASTGDAVAGYFETEAPGGWAVKSYSPWVGVAGYGTATTGFTYGVYGNAPTNGWAGYFSGRVNVTGTLSKAGGSFKIDHPLDPANQYLQHSFVESPDMKNVYDGVVKLGGKGDATIELPDWFDALNKDFRYQLTPIGASAPDLFVKSGVKDNQFTIAGGTPGLEVSWQVTGIRKDAWAKANRIEVEVAKTGDEKGRYMHPELHGKPASKGLRMLNPGKPRATKAHNQDQR